MRWERSDDEPCCSLLFSKSLYMKYKLVWIVIVSLLHFTTNAQTTKVFSENGAKGTTIYASNTDLFPMSVSLELDLSNMVFSEGGTRLFVVPPKSEKYKHGEITAQGPGKTKWGYKFKTTWAM